MTESSIKPIKWSHEVKTANRNNKDESMIKNMNLKVKMDKICFLNNSEIIMHSLTLTPNWILNLKWPYRSVA